MTSPLFVTPSLAELKQLRRYQKIDLLRLYKKDCIFKDSNGYYFFENELFSKSEGEKFYFEESFVFLEENIISHYKEASNTIQLFEKLISQNKTEKRVLVEVALKYMKIDYKLHLLFQCLMGQNYLPFMSRQQLSNWLLAQLTLDLYFITVSSVHTTPLQSYHYIKKTFEPKLLKKLFESIPDHTKLNKKIFLHESIPYGMKQKK